MTMNRRQFLKSILIGGAGVSVPVSVLPSTKRPPDIEAVKKLVEICSPRRIIPEYRHSPYFFFSSHPDSFKWSCVNEACDWGKAPAEVIHSQVGEYQGIKIFEDITRPYVRNTPTGGMVVLHKSHRGAQNRMNQLVAQRLNKLREGIKRGNVELSLLRQNDLLDPVG